MDTETKKNNFMNLLRDVYLANTESRKTITLLEILEPNDGILRIDNTTLVEFGFGDRYFWEVMCPALKAKGILKSFEDPEVPLAASIINSPEYLELQKKLNRLNELAPLSNEDGTLSRGNRDIFHHKRTRVEIESTEKEVADLEKNLESDYRHKFEVDEELLFDDSKKTKNEDRYYIVKRGDAFYYEGVDLELDIKHVYVQAFAVLHRIAPQGGLCTYKKYKKEFRLAHKDTFSTIKVNFNTWAQTNLSEKGKGILRRVENKKLITTKSGTGFEYNNLKK